MIVTYRRNPHLGLVYGSYSLERSREVITGMRGVCCRNLFGEKTLLRRKGDTFYRHRYKSQAMAEYVDQSCIYCTDCITYITACIHSLHHSEQEGLYRLWSVAERSQIRRETFYNCSMLIPQLTGANNARTMKHFQLQDKPST